MRSSSNSRLLQILSMYQSDLHTVFHMMGEKPDDWDNYTLRMSSGYDRWLTKDSTYFFIMAYEDISSGMNALFGVLQIKILAIGFCATRLVLWNTRDRSLTISISVLSRNATQFA